MQAYSYAQHKKGNRIGFVPTMGALHAGHLSLIAKAAKKSEIVVVSIFVNPTQFGPGEGYESYPKTLKSDLDKLINLGLCDVVFIPNKDTLYPDGFKTIVEVLQLTDVLCGKTRTSHFKGVTTIVEKLLHCVNPDVVIFGQKDYQQAIVIKQMLRDLNHRVQFVLAPTVRNKDGLAESSRNKYLLKEEKTESTILYKMLSLARQLVLKQGIRKSALILNRAKKLLKTCYHVKLEYFEIVDATTLQNVSRIKGKVLIAIAARVGKTRLIDNVLVQVH